MTVFSVTAMYRGRMVLYREFKTLELAEKCAAQFASNNPFDELYVKEKKV